MIMNTLIISPPSTALRHKKRDFDTYSNNQQQISGVMQGSNHANTNSGNTTRSLKISGSKRAADHDMLGSYDRTDVFASSASDLWHGSDDENCAIVKRSRGSDDVSTGEVASDKGTYTEAEMLQERREHLAARARTEAIAELNRLQAERQLAEYRHRTEVAEASVRGLKRIVEAAAAERHKLQQEDKILKHAVLTQSQRIQRAEEQNVELRRTIMRQKEENEQLREACTHLLSQLSQHMDNDKSATSRDQNGHDFDGFPPYGFAQ